MTDLATLRTAIRADHLADEGTVLDRLIAGHAPDVATRAAAHTRATGMVEAMRANARPGLMEVFLAEYGLSTKEGVALMCLAEALLRVPDADTMDDLIEDKIAPSEWGAHLGRSSSSLVNASTWALMLTGKVLQDGQGMAGVLRSAVKRIGEPVIRAAVGQAMREMGRQFVLGETMPGAMARAAKMEARGYSYSYDMLGEAAMTARDAEAYFKAYAEAIATLTPACTHDDIRQNPGISIKLSALHPRYAEAQRDRVMAELVPRVAALAQAARANRMGLNIDAEEADRLDLSLDVIAAVLADDALAGWDGFGVVVQGYGLRAGAVLDWLHALAVTHDRRIMVRLVKGAYWDTEIKRAQVAGLSGFPVFTRKPATDAAYLCCAQKLLGMTDRIYPQFATHNAATVTTILEMAADPTAFEFQRLHGMGEALHEMVRKGNATRCRIYAPVGAHRDLLAYLVRRLLENGANSSFVHQILDADTAAAEVASDPFADLDAPARGVTWPTDLFAPRRNSRGWDLADPTALDVIDAARAPFASHHWQAAPILAGPILADTANGDVRHDVVNPADHGDVVGMVQEASEADIATALNAARPWDAPVAERATVLRRAAELYETHFGELFALLAREAGKSLPDAVGELREAVDFLTYYADQAAGLTTPARGLFTCISPWNFPLAIFTGQIAAALAAGNGVLAKPAETTSLIAARATALLHEAGVPRDALQLLPGEGGLVGTALVSDARIGGVCFTGSTATAQTINRAMAAHLAPGTPLIAETGGINAMIVDSTALPEQAVRDIVASAFQSAGQRCSALRMLYVQEDIAKGFLEMLTGAMAEQHMGNPWALRCDIGPVIDARAQTDIQGHVDAAKAEGRLIAQLDAPVGGTFVGPAIIRLPGGISALPREVFGPVLHVATFKASRMDKVVADVNARRFGLTFGMHSRIDDRVQAVCGAVRVGNLYVNRNQIGAVVGSQPFGGEGMSGTGPKAGGPEYLPRFAQSTLRSEAAVAGNVATTEAVTEALSALPRPVDVTLSTRNMPGPTGESNRLSTHPRGRVLCLGPGLAAARDQASQARAAGCSALTVVPDGDVDGVLAPERLAEIDGIDAVILWSDDARVHAQVMAARDGALIPLILEANASPRLIIERHLCIDTTAAGGNAQLLAAAG
jgi:RHH-type proline utilization regulon transcriptional repressor/proline dehydrogenase/delta 1-pyrroline-5-carboxylate dehydrogenase